MQKTYSILASIRPLVHVEQCDDSYDEQLIPLVNLAIQRIRQNNWLTDQVVQIQDVTNTWEEVVGESEALLAMAPIFVSSYIRTHGFDTPTNSQVLESLKETERETLWLIREEIETNGFIF